MNTHRGFEPEDLDRLQSASSWLHGLADNDCNCEGDAAERRLNPCSVCQARHARDLIEQCLAPRHEVLWPERLKNTRGLCEPCYRTLRRLIGVSYEREDCC